MYFQEFAQEIPDNSLKHFTKLLCAFKQEAGQASIAITEQIEVRRREIGRIWRMRRRSIRFSSKNSVDIFATSGRALSACTVDFRFADLCFN
jgi:hypothetical protein